MTKSATSTGASGRRQQRLLVLSFVLLTACSGGTLGGGGPLVGSSLVGQGDKAKVTLVARPNEQPQYWGVLVIENEGQTEVELSSAKIVSADKELQPVGFAVLRTGDNEVGSLAFGCGPFPPPNWATHPLKGFRLKVGGTASILTAVLPTDEGVLRARDVELNYRAGGKSYRLKLKVTSEINVSASNGKCIIDKQDHRRS